MHLPRQVLVSDLLRARVRDEHAADFGVGHQVWMHPPTHRVLGWASRPVSFGAARYVWRLNQLHQLHHNLAVVCGEPAATEQATLDLLPQLLGARLHGHHALPLGLVADAAIDTGSGAIQHYLVARSDPRLPGTSRWLLLPGRIVDQQPGRVEVAIDHLSDLPIARASIREQLLQAGHGWRDGLQQRTSRVGRQLEQWNPVETTAETLHNVDVGAIGEQIGSRWNRLQNRFRSAPLPADPPRSDRSGRRPGAADPSDAEAWDHWDHPPHRQRTNHDQPMDAEPWL